MAEEKQNIQTEMDADATRITPLFDEEAAETAQPVIPLTEGRESRRSNPIIITTDPAQPPYAPVTAPRSWLLGLVLVSVLFGSVLGGLGLRFYQKRLRAAADAPSPVAAVEEAAAAPVVAAQSTSADATASEVSQPSAEIPAPEIPAAETPVEEAREETPARPKEDEDDKETKEPDKRIDRDEEIRKPARYDARESSRRDDGKRGETKKSAREELRAEREEARPYLFGTIRPRRSEQEQQERRRERRRARRERQSAEAPLTDRVRSIFEGQP